MPYRIKFVSAVTGPVGLDVDSDQWAVDIITRRQDAGGKIVPQMLTIEAWTWAGERSKRFVRLSDDYFKTMPEAKAAWRNGFITSGPDEAFPASHFVKRLLEDQLAEVVQ